MQHTIDNPEFACMVADFHGQYWVLPPPPLPSLHSSVSPQCQFSVRMRPSCYLSLSLRTNLAYIPKPPQVNDGRRVHAPSCAFFKGAQDIPDMP